MTLDFKQADSKEEVYFSWWLDELLEAGYIAAHAYHPTTYDLSPNQEYSVNVHLKTKTNVEEKTLLQPHTYTPDFSIVWNPKAYGIFFYSLADGFNIKKIPLVAKLHGNMYDETVIDIKPPQSKWGKSYMEVFSINQKWTYEKHGVYVQKVVVVGAKSKKTKKVTTGLFPTTFTPERYLMTDTAIKPRKLHYKPKTL